jgi:hypothetical protein
MKDAFLTDWDDDIAKLNLSQGEKDGLQVFRNYQRAFEDSAEKEFSKKIDATKIDATRLNDVLRLIAKEDLRVLPVIVCAYCDDQLKEMFEKQIINDSLISKTSLFGPYGPLSNLFNRIQLTHAFELVSGEVMRDLDKVRSARNKLSHTWNTDSLKQFYTTGEITKIFPIENILQNRSDWFAGIKLEELSKSPDKVFRVRLIWLVMRITYETMFFYEAKKKNLNPVRTLYGKNAPKFLGNISANAIEITLEIIG